uniref:Uncharacterized protein n=1 Tax=Anguilla anguilla TaxID=7936 RepID=A0A0E9VPN1_ANGAN
MGFKLTTIWVLCILYSLKELKYTALYCKYMESLKNIMINVLHCSAMCYIM